MFVNILLAGFIVPRQLYSSDVSWLQPSHQPPILSTIPWCSNHIARRCGSTKVRNGLQYYLQMLANSPVNFLLPTSLLLQSMQQYTTHNNQTPRNNQSLDQLQIFANNQRTTAQSREFKLEVILRKLRMITFDESPSGQH